MKDKLRILFLGADGGNAIKRAHALRRLGHEVMVVDPYSLFPFKQFVGRLIYYGGASLIESYLKKKITPIISKLKFDVTYVDNGELIGSKILSVVKKGSTLVINYNNDDPFGTGIRKSGGYILKLSLIMICWRWCGMSMSPKPMPWGPKRLYRYLWRWMNWTGHEK